MPHNKIGASWKRRQDNLIKSLFQDLPPFSPVPEENESADSSYLRNQPPSVAPESSYRPPSPLPPLIIEVEPNRHDQPEEFYKKLETRILKYYRKLFIEDQSEVTMMKSSSDVLSRSNSNEDGDRDSLSASVPDGADAEEINAVTCDTPTTERSMDYRVVTFQADVHREAADDMVPPPSVVRDLGTVEADIHIGGDSQDLLENRYVPDNIDIIPEVDVMRTPQIRASAGSLHTAANSFSPENMSPRSMQEPSLRAHTEPSSSDDRESNVEEEGRESVSIDFDALHRISTPIDGVNALEGSVVNEHSRTRKRSGSSSSSSCNSSKRPRYEEAGTQTSEDRDSRMLPYWHGSVASRTPSRGQSRTTDDN